MATGASNCELAVILVDASKGVAVQTRRHAIICSLLGIRHIVLAVNKMDLDDFSEDVFDRIVEQFRFFTESHGIDNVAAVPMSALDGDMVVDRGAHLRWYRGPTLLQILETAEVPESLAEAPFRFPVQCVARPTATLPRGYMGRVESGSVAVGDAIRVLPTGRS